MRRRRASLALGVAWVVACGGARPATTAPPEAPPAASATPTPAAPDASAAEPPPPPPDPLLAALDAQVALYEAIAALPSGAPCRDAAVAIERLVGERAGALTEVRAAAIGERRGEVDRRFEALSPRLAAAAIAIDALVQRCAGEAAVAIALGRLAGEAAPGEAAPGEATR